MKYFCNECGNTFNEPKNCSDYHGEGRLGGYEEYQICPICGGGDWDYSLICPECGEYCGKLYGEGEYQLCGYCVEKASIQADTDDFLGLTKDDFAVYASKVIFGNK